MKKNISIKLKNSLLFIFVAFISFSQAQNKELRELLNQTVTIDENHIKIRAHILAEYHEIKPKDDRVYYWFQSGQINHTRGGYSGHILEGDYKEFFSDNNLKAQGEFRIGLKHGDWKYWYPNGEHQRTEKWKHGELDGDFKEYDKSGQLTKEGSYKNGQLHGKLIIYSEGEEVKTTFYKSGEEITKEQNDEEEKEALNDKKDKKKKEKKVKEKRKRKKKNKKAKEKKQKKAAKTEQE